jgi:tRNA threonylcarbamoyladenosine biosynthesis protein TsaE
MGRIGLVSGTYTLRDAEETIAFGKMAASLLQNKTILALSGDLGAGKTTFVQGLAKGLGISEPVQSPTFVLLNIYDKLAHFDLYRLKKSSEFTGLGFEEYFDREGICVIEWPDRIADILPKGTVYIDFIYQNEGRIAKVRT